MGTSEVPSYWEYWHSDNANKPKTNNFTNFSHPELDKLIDLFRAEFDIEKKQALSRDIQTIIHESDVVVPSYMLPWTRQGNWRWVKYPQNPMNKWTKSLFDANRQVSYGTYWLDVDVKKETQQAKKEGTAFEPVTVIDDRYKS
jgi:microcin C transport system substrate-binding protein